MQGCLATGAHPVAHTHRHSDHRLRHQPGQHRGKCPFHTSAGDQHAGLLELLQLSQQPVQSSNAHIQHQIALDPVPLKGQLGFAGYR